MSLPRNTDSSKKLSPSWTAGVLSQGGLQAPSRALIEQALNRMEPDEISKMQLTLQKLCRGDETEEEMAYLKRWIGAISEQTQSLQNQSAAKAIAPPSVPTSKAAHMMAGTGQMLPQNARRIRAPKAHVYGSKAALCFEVVPVHANNVPEAELKHMSVQIEGARSKGNGAFDWEQKTILRLSETELALMCALFQGYIDKLEFKHHGTERNKSISMVYQPDRGSVFVEMSKPSWSIAVPITFEDYTQVSGVLLKALAANMVGVDFQAVDRVIKRTAQMYATSKAQ
jgi:hypothetical protein